MRCSKIITAIICGALIVIAVNARSFGKHVRGPAGSPPAPAASDRYRLDASQSTFIAHAHAGGLLWFKGHDHLVAVREFTGEAQLTPNALNQSSLLISAKTASMVETSSVFTEPQKQIIDKELREIVLLPD